MKFVACRPRSQSSFLAIFLLVSLLMQSCATTRNARWGEMDGGTAANEEQAAALIEEGDRLFELRSDREKLVEALKLWEEAAKLVENSDIYVKLARGHYFLADGFYGIEGNVEMRDKHFTIGLGFAEKSLQYAAPQVIDEVSNGSKFYQAIRNAPIEAVPGMYWYAANLGKWAASKGFITRLRYKDDIKETMDRVMSLEPQYFHAGPWRYFGAYEAITAGLAGGDLKKSRESFEAAVRMAPDYLGTKVLWAEYLCTKTQDRETFEKLMHEVLEANPNNQAIAPENAVEKQKARKLLAQIEDHF